jgi:cell division GTPase FtsZ
MTAVGRAGLTGIIRVGGGTPIVSVAAAKVAKITRRAGIVTAGIWRRVFRGRYERQRAQQQAEEDLSPEQVDTAAGAR